MFLRLAGKIILFVLLLNVISEAQQIFTIGNSKSKIEKNHILSKLHIDILENNISIFYSDSDAKNINFFILDNLKKENICGLNFYYFLGFYKDSLFAIFASTEELPAEFELKNEKCLNKHFYISDSNSTIEFVRKSSPTSGGNIFGEAGTIIKSTNKDKYIVALISNGMSVFSPSHQQYAFIILSKKIIDKLNANVKIYKGHKLKINSSDLFTTPLYEHFDN